MPPTTGVLDNFNRANETPIGTNWTAASTGFGKPNLTSNTLQYPSSSYRDCCWNTSFNENQEVYFTIPATSSSRFIEIFARITNPNTTNLTAYNVEINTTTGGWTLSKIIKNTYTSLKTGTKVYVAGDKVWLKCEGTSIKAVHITALGVETTVIETTDSAVAGSGQIGCGMQSSGAELTIDEFGGGSLSGAKTVEGKASISGTGTFSAKGRKETFGKVPILGTGTFAAKGVRSTTSSAAIVGTSSLSAKGTRSALGVASITGTSAFSAKGTRSTATSAVISGSGSLSAAGARTTQGKAQIVGTGTLSAAGFNESEEGQKPKNGGYALYPLSKTCPIRQPNYVKA